MSDQHPTARPARIDPRRVVTGAKAATLVVSAVAFGAVTGLVIGSAGTAAATAPTQTGAIGASALDASGAAQPTPAQDFFAVPPGFAQPPLADGGSGSGSSSGRAAPGQAGFGSQGVGGQGVGGQVPNLRSSGS